jgi:chromosome segregation ATPase
MSNQNYVNHYIDILTGTMTDAIIRNVSLQATAKINEEVLNNHQNELEQLRNGNVGQISQLNNEISSLRQQLDHLDTFRNELIRERVEHEKTKSNYEETIKGLKDRIEFLQLTPAKRSKIEAKTIKLSEPEPEVFEPAIELVTITKDGGSF